MTSNDDWSQWKVFHKWRQINCTTRSTYFHTHQFNLLPCADVQPTSMRISSTYFMGIISPYFLCISSSYFMCISSIYFHVHKSMSTKSQFEDLTMLCVHHAGMQVSTGSAEWPVQWQKTSWLAMHLSYTAHKFAKFVFVWSWYCENMFCIAFLCCK